MLVVEGSPPVAGTPVKGVERVELPDCVELLRCIELPDELGVLGILVVEGSPPVAGTLVELDELGAGDALLG
jgi:hypothetical protein